MAGGQEPNSGALQQYLVAVDFIGKDGHPVLLRHGDDGRQVLLQGGPCWYAHMRVGRGRQSRSGGWVGQTALIQSVHVWQCQALPGCGKHPSRTVH